MALSRRPSSKDLLAQANKAREIIKAQEEEERRLRQAAEEAKVQEEEDERRHKELRNRIADLRKERVAKESAIAKYLAEMDSLDADIEKAQAELEKYATPHLESVDEALAYSHQPIDDIGAAHHSTAATSAHEDTQGDGPKEPTQNETSDAAFGQQNLQQPGTAELGDEDKTDGVGRSPEETQPSVSSVTQESDALANQDHGSTAEESDDSDDDDDPVRGGPRRGRARASSTPSNCLLVEDETSIHRFFPMVLSLDDQWHEVKCYICGANRPRDDPKFFTAVSELLKHISFTHFRGCEKRPLERKETLLRGSQRIFGPDDVKTLQSGQNLETNPIEPTRGTAIDGCTDGMKRSRSRANIEEEKVEEDDSHTGANTASGPTLSSSSRHNQPRDRRKSSGDASEPVKVKGHAGSSVARAASSVRKPSRLLPPNFAFGADLMTGDIAPQPSPGLAEAPQIQHPSIIELVESIPPGHSQSSPREDAIASSPTTTCRKPTQHHLEASRQSLEVEERREELPETIQDHSQNASGLTQKTHPPPVSASPGNVSRTESVANSGSSQLPLKLDAVAATSVRSKSVEASSSRTSVTPGIFSGRSRPPSQELQDAHAQGSASKTLTDNPIFQTRKEPVELFPGRLKSSDRSKAEASFGISAKKRPHGDVRGDPPAALNLSILHSRYPNTAHLEGNWYLIRCKVCHANASRTESGELMFFRGIEGLQQHVREAHRLEGDYSAPEMWCEASLIPRQDVHRLNFNIDLPILNARSAGKSTHNPASAAPQLGSSPRKAQNDLSRDPRMHGRPSGSILSIATTVPPVRSARSAQPREENSTSGSPKDHRLQAQDEVCAATLPTEGALPAPFGTQMSTMPFNPQQRARSTPPRGEHTGRGTSKEGMRKWQLLRALQLRRHMKIMTARIDTTATTSRSSERTSMSSGRGESLELIADWNSKLQRSSIKFLMHRASFAS
ncbi:uncharacterized protein MYCFIDRAFT_178269 [Pseudocercospora fijiensis CIRAD86]|uniref:Uncharacterized protein n=1 Tax=Pseudocercospora fijiensis (strain CIRAD86) TaxID=383855 RepID=M3ARK8_PSEFD|nr:uncharacterized protein MYCFIDRAFT_178269 [Pseudocercospora fijiensis CIRAD86]EME79698.1 hypothetical protein MYCFIDRAFT_178269 [Pseudocercospora fijiensis CIRAD86]